MSTTEPAAVPAIEPAAPPRRTFAQRLRAFADPRPARWRLVIVLGIVLAYADGYVLVALTGAVGAIERTNHPFGAWLEESAVLVPFVILAELLVLRLIRRRTARSTTSATSSRSWKTVAVAAMLIAVGTTVVGVVAVTASAAYDYRLQTDLIDYEEQPALENETNVPLIPAGTTVARGNCNSMICNEERFSLATDLRGVGIGAPILLGVNIILVGWVIAGFGGRLGAPQRRRRT